MGVHDTQVMPIWTNNIKLSFEPDAQAFMQIELKHNETPYLGLSFF